MRLLKNAQMQVELCEIPLAGARKIPRDAGQMGVFQQPVILPNLHRVAHAREAHGA